MFKKHMKAAKGTQKLVHKNKGSDQASMPDRAQVQALARPGANSVNDYAKATPMAQSPTPPFPTEGGGF